MKSADSTSLSDTDPSPHVAAGSIYNDHMQTQFSGSPTDTDVKALGFAPILDANASLVSDGESTGQLAYMDQEFSDKDWRQGTDSVRSEASDSRLFSPHLNKNSVERLGEYSRRHI